jgi:hypothetical protein
MPVLQVHGTADSIVKYSGVAATINGWVNRNGCPTTAQVTEPYPASNPSSAVRKDYYGPCNQNSEVILLTVNGAGHVWPGGYGASFGINAAEEAWAFFKNHSLSAATRQSAIKSQRADEFISVTRDARSLRIQCYKQIQCIRMLDIRGRIVSQWAVPAGSSQFKMVALHIPDIPSGLGVIAVDIQDKKAAAMLMVP